MDLLSQEELDRLFKYYLANTKNFQFGVLENDEPAFRFVDQQAVLLNSDGSIDWKVHEIALNFHCFIELTTGGMKRRTVYMPLCLLSERTRRAFKPLLASTVDPKDGRLNSKAAQFWIIMPSGNGFRVHCKLRNLAMHFVLLELCPKEFASSFKTNLCPFCRKESSL